MTSFVVAIITSIGSGLLVLLSFWEMIQNKEQKGIRRVKAIGWLIILIALLTTGFSIGGIYISNTEKRTSDSLISTYQGRIDSFREESKNAAIQQQRKLESTTLTLIDRFTVGTKTVIESAQIDAEKLRDTIKVLKERQKPNITYTLSNLEPLRTIQSNDTFFVLMSIRNSGGSIAKEVSFKTHYLHIEGVKVYEYYKPFCTANNIEIPAGESKTYNKGRNAYILNFQFDSTKTDQFLLVTGSYLYDEERREMKTFVICYSWNVINQKWGEYTNVDDIKRLHNSKDLILF